MKQGFIIFFIVFFHSTVVFSQLSTVEPIDIVVSYDKSMHLIFPAKINYFDIGISDYSANRPEKAQHILEIKAMDKDITSISNLTVVTNDGKYYSFRVKFTKNLLYTAIDADKITDSKITEESIVKAEFIEASDNNSTHLIFPSPLVYINYGSSSIKVSKVKETDNIVRLQALHTGQINTNLSAVTDDNKFYTFNITYSDNPKMLTYVVGNTNESIALFRDEQFNEITITDVIAKIEGKGRQISHLGVNSNNIHFHIDNIFIDKNKLYFDMVIENNLNIDYDLETRFPKFYIEDKKKSKKTISQSEEVEPLFKNNFNSKISGRTKSRLIFAFDKFTIPDAKQFVIRLKESNGGRDILFKVENKDIMNAKYF